MRYISGQEILSVIQSALPATVYVTAQTMEPHDDHWGGCLEFRRFRPNHYWFIMGFVSALLGFIAQSRVNGDALASTEAEKSVS